MRIRTTNVKLVTYCVVTGAIVATAVALLTGSAAPHHVEPTVKWEYRQIALTADFSEWNRLGQEGWEFAGTFERAVIFKRQIRER